MNYRKNSLEARLDSLLPEGKVFKIVFHGLVCEPEGGWSVNDSWTAHNNADKEDAISILRDRWEIFKLNYLPKARVRDITDLSYTYDEIMLEVDYTAFATLTTI